MLSRVCFESQEEYKNRYAFTYFDIFFLINTFQTVNIPDAYADPRFDASVDESTGFKHNTILCMAIKNSEGRIIGVIQVRRTQTITSLD